MRETINRGTYKDDDFNEIIKKNMMEHGHGRWMPPARWKEDLDILINKFGWKVFEAHKVIKESRTAEVNEEEVTDGS
jgi:hypothetical protein